jgi:hypothetical protein
MTPQLRRRRFNAISDLGCCVCVREGLGATPPEIHHVLEGRIPGRRNSDDQTIGLCPYHHRHGPTGEALHAGPQSFEAMHGSEMELLAWTNKRIGWHSSATIAGEELPRSAA